MRLGDARLVQAQTSTAAVVHNEQLLSSLTWAHHTLLQVVLDMEEIDSGAVMLQAPPNSSVAPPGLYMLFLLSDGVPSTAVWVSAPASCVKQQMKHCLSVTS